MKTRAFYVAPPREFPLSVRATFPSPSARLSSGSFELQIVTHKFTPLSKLNIRNLVYEGW